MRRWFVTSIAVLVVALALLTPAPVASAYDAPIGRLGDTLRVELKSIVADVTVGSVQPVPPPPGFGYQRGGVPVWGSPDGGVWRADVVIHAVRTPNPFQMAANFSFVGVTDFGDGYKSRPSDAPDMLDAAMGNAPAGSFVRGGVYWDVYRDPVTHVVLLDRNTGYHLAQWNL